MDTTARGMSIRSTILVAILGGMLLSACGPALPRAQAEKEIGAFMLDHLIVQQTGAGAGYRRTAGQPWGSAPQQVSFIVWAPPVDNYDPNGIEYLNTDKPLQAWWLAGSDLTEITSDKAAALRDYRATRMGQPRAEGQPWGWRYVEYGIVALSDGNRKARVYVGDSCGPLCGTGTIYSLERDASGRWSIRDSEMRWIS